MAPPLLWAWPLLALAVGGAVGGACTGKRWSLTGSGALSDGAGNYSVMGDCIWVLHAPPGQRVLLTLMEVETECGFDFLFVFDGPASRGRLLAALSGNAPPPPLLEAASGQMLVQLFSDANYNLGGFSGRFRSSRCPGGCGGRGRCDPRGHCVCQPGWGGADCRRELCPMGCPPPGVCNQASGRCECPPGYVGRSCELDVWGAGGGGQWYPISDGDDVYGARMGAAGVLLPHTGGLYVFGGQSLGAPLGDLVMFNFSTNSWSRILHRPAPAARHSHTACRWRDGLVLYGGELRGGAVARDVWLYRPQRGWTELQPKGPPRGPPRAAHGAAVVGEWLYVSGGRSDGDAVSAALFRFHLGRRRWERLEPWGGRPPAAAAHSVLWDPWSRSLLIHGGVRPSSARFSSRVNTTDAFHVGRRHWSTLRLRDGGSGAPPVGFHSASRIGRYMVVFGGSVHQHYEEEQCYGDGLYFYHLGCHQWVSAPTLSPGSDFPPPQVGVAWPTWPQCWGAACCWCWGASAASPGGTS